MATRTLEPMVRESSPGTDAATLKGEPMADETANENEPHGKEAAETTDEQDDTPYLSGLKLFLVMAGTTLVCFLAMLDIAIISTVRQGSRRFPR